jgi:hypothetical protein
VAGAEPSNFRQQVEPEIDGGKISLLAKVNEEAEESFPSAAAALLFAIGWPRAFGLDMIEAMTSDGLHNCDIEEEAKRWHGQVQGSAALMPKAAGRSIISNKIARRSARHLHEKERV